MEAGDLRGLPKRALLIVVKFLILRNPVFLSLQIVNQFSR